MSVLESLRLHLAEFTLPRVLEEIGDWLHCGSSRFASLLTAADLPPPSEPQLPRLFPAAKAA